MGRPAGAGGGDERAALACHLPQPLDQRADRAMMAIALSTLLRSEEHTSELQSHVRISYAVFCLKKKKKKEKQKN